MTKHTVAVTDYGFPDLKQEEEVLTPMGFDFVTGRCKTPDEVMQITKNADLYHNKPLRLVFREFVEQVTTSCSPGNPSGGLVLYCGGGYRGGIQIKL